MTFEKKLSFSKSVIYQGVPFFIQNLGLLPWHRLHEVPASFYQHKPLCMESYGLSRSQLVMCHQNFDHMPIVSIGARIGILQCEEQFKFRHWNCTSGKDAFSIGTHTRHGHVVMEHEG
ncbi:hypothetical protein ACTXT7_011146 [Hymenolepis weldensis]